MRYSRQVSFLIGVVSCGPARSAVVATDPLCWYLDSSYENRGAKLLPFFRSEAQLRILALLFLNGDRPWTADQVVEAVDAPATTVHRELRRALDAGLVVRDESVRPHSYRAATGSPVYEPLEALLASTVGLESELSELLDETPGVRAASSTAPGWMVESGPTATSTCWWSERWTWVSCGAAPGRSAAEPAAGST